MKFNRSIIIFLSVLFLSSCRTSPANETNDEVIDLYKDTSIKFARRFLIDQGKDFKVIHILANRETSDTSATFILYDSVKPNLKYKHAHFIKKPCTRIVVLSSIYANMISEVGGLKNIVAIENVDYYNNSGITKSVEAGRILQVQRNPEIDKEAVVKLKPDIIFAFGMGGSSGDFDPKLVESGIPVAISLDHLEKSPLARAEWIKFFAAFVNKSDEANIIFSEVVKDYNQLSSMAKNYKDKPNVLTELKFGDVWYVPGGRSYMAQLINDANGNYVWSEDTATGSLPLSFETVYKKAQNADLWLNVSMCTSIEQVKAQDGRYASFNAYKTKAIYNNNLYANKLNYSTYWETGMMYPNRILCDMIQIFHKPAKDSLDRPFYYYKQLN
jgi:iron complex transport system substrate-binding protein